MTQSKLGISPAAIAPLGGHRNAETFRATWIVTNESDQGLSSVRARLASTRGLRFISKETVVDGKDVSVTITEDGADVILPAFSPGQSHSLRAWFAIECDDIAEEQQVTLGVSASDVDSAVDSATIPIVGTARIVAVAATTCVIKAEPSHFGLKIELRNEGNTEENDIHCFVGTPRGVTMVRNQSNVDQTVVPEEGGIRVTVPSLAANSDVTIGIELHVDVKADPGDIVLPEISVSSKSSGRSHLGPLVVHMPTTYSLETSSLSVGNDSGVLVAGDDVSISVTARNSARNDAHGVKVHFQIPHEIIISPGSVAVDGVTDSRHDPSTFVLVPFIATGGEVIVSLKGIVRSPVPNGTIAQIEATVDEQKLEPHAVTIQSRAKFGSKTTTLMKALPTHVAAGGETHVRCYVRNEGSDQARNTSISFDVADATVLSAQVQRDGDWQDTRHTNTTKNGRTIAIVNTGDLMANETTAVDITIVTPEIFSDDHKLEVSVSLAYNETETYAIGSVHVLQHSQPSIGKMSSITAKRTEPMTIGQMRVLSLRIENDGDDSLEQVKVELNLHPSMRLQSAQGVFTNDDGTLNFEPIAAGAVAHANIVVVVHEDMPTHVSVRPRVHAKTIATKELPELVLSYRRDPSAAIISATKTPLANGDLLVRAVVQNTGTTVIDLLTLGIVTEAVSVPGKTTRDGETIQDVSNATALFDAVHIVGLLPGKSTSVSTRLKTNSEERVSFSLNVDELWTTNLDARTEIDSIETHGTRDNEQFDGSEIDQSIHFENTPVETETDADELEDKTTPASEEPKQTTASVKPEVGSKPSEKDSVKIHEDDMREDHGTEPSWVTDETIQNEPVTEEVITAQTDTEADDDVLSWPTLKTDATNPEPQPQTEKSKTEPTTAAIDSQQHKGWNLPDEVDLTPADTSEKRSPIKASRGLIGPLGTVTYDNVRIKRLRAALTRMPASLPIGWYRHVLTMSMLIPTELHVDASDSAVSEAWQNVVNEASNLARGPLVKVTMKDFQPNEEWAQSVLSKNLVSYVDKVKDNLLNCLAVPTPQLSTNQARSNVGLGYRDIFDRELDRNDGIGAGHALLVLAETIPTDLPEYPELSAALSTYKEALIHELTPLVYQGETARQRKLLTGGKNVMDPALEALLARLIEIK